MFIAFEGQDGAGNSTQSRFLTRFLTDRGERVLLTKEPTSSFIGGIIRSVLRREIKTSPLALQMLFTADRAHHLYSQIEPALKEGKIVISDRYMFSTLAFGGLSIDIDFLKKVNSNFRIPDITFIIDVPPEVCMERIRRSRTSEPELFEDVAKFEKIRANYMQIKNQFPNMYLIDGNRRIEDVAADIRRIVTSRLK